MEPGSHGVRESKPPPRSAGAGGGGGFEEVVGGSSSRPLSAEPPPALGAPVASGRSGGVGPGGRLRLRDVGTDAFDQLVAGGHVEAAAARSAAEFRARTDPASASYKLDVDVEKAGDVLTRQEVLEEAKDPDRSRAFHAHYPRLNLGMPRLSGALEERDEVGDAPPTRSGTLYSQIYEILSFVIDKPNHLTQLPTLLSAIGLNIRDAHAFSRKDRYAFNDFTVECWPIKDAENLHKVLVVLVLINKMQGLWSDFGSSSILVPFHTYDYESDMDTTLLNIGEKVTPGSCGVMFHGTHDGAKIIFGILCLAYLDQNAWNKFAKEISTSREAHHANIARLLGTCTKLHQFCTTIEYMSEGSLFCFLRNEHVVLDLPTLVKLAQHGCRRIKYLPLKGTVHWNFNPSDLLMDKEHVVGLGKCPLPRFKGQETTRTAKPETHKSMVPEGQSCGYCETTLAAIQSLDRLAPTLEKILEQLTKHCTVVQNSHGTEEVLEKILEQLSKNCTAVQNSHGTEVEKLDIEDKQNKLMKQLLELLSKHCTLVQDSHGTENAENLDSEEKEKKMMEKFNRLLVDCVFFALPQVLIFFPQYEVKSKAESNQRLSLLKLTQDADGSSSEKNVVISFFVIFVTVWFLGLFLSQFGRGHCCTGFASALTACAAICTIAFIDYSLCKCLPEETLYVVLFSLHFAAMVVGIGYVWFTYIKVPQLPTIQWTWRRDPRLHVDAEPKDELGVPLVTPYIV